MATCPVALPGLAAPVAEIGQPTHDDREGRLSAKAMEDEKGKVPSLRVRVNIWCKGKSHNRCTCIITVKALLKHILTSIILFMITLHQKLRYKSFSKNLYKNKQNSCALDDKIHVHTH